MSHRSLYLCYQRSTLWNVSHTEHILSVHLIQACRLNQLILHSPQKEMVHLLMMPKPNHDLERKREKERTKYNLRLKFWYFNIKYKYIWTHAYIFFVEILTYLLMFFRNFCLFCQKQIFFIYDNPLIYIAKLLN